MPPCFGVSTQRNAGPSTHTAFKAEHKLEPVAVSRPFKMKRGAERHNPGRVDVPVSYVVVPFYVINIDGGGNTGLLIKVSQVSIQVGIVYDAADVALKVTEINRIEADQGAKQAPISFDDAFTKEEPLAR
jgi:hypothetical protein